MKAHQKNGLGHNEKLHHNEDTLLPSSASQLSQRSNQDNSEVWGAVWTVTDGQSHLDLGRADAYGVPVAHHMHLLFGKIQMEDYRLQILSLSQNYHPHELMHIKRNDGDYAIFNALMNVCSLQAAES